MSNVIELIDNNHYAFWCPGCKMTHSITVNGAKNVKQVSWKWDGDLEKPTFAPSILVKHTYVDGKPTKTCHSFIRGGVWEFLSDCTHDLAGQKVPMKPVDEEDD